MRYLKPYLKTALGVEVEEQPVGRHELKQVPFALMSLYNFFSIKLFDRNLLLVHVKNEFTTDQLKKHFEVLQQKFGHSCVAILDSLESNKRMRLIEKQIPFIVPGKQMFLPFLLIDLKEYKQSDRIQPEKMQPAAQFLLLYHLQKESLEGYNFKDIAEKLSYTPMTITRAAFFLHNVGLCEITGTKEKQLHFELKGMELWKKAEPMMLSPVKQSSYYNGHVHFDDFLKCNISALAHYTNINPEPVDYYAIHHNLLHHYIGTNLMKSSCLEGNIVIEEWLYSPMRLGTNGIVDPLSLYLSMRDHKNERIEMALEQLLENVKW